MNAREDMLGRVQKALAPLPTRAPLPNWDAELAVAHRLVDQRDLVELFIERIKLVNGMAMLGLAEVAAFLQKGGWMRGYCDPALKDWVAQAFGPAFSLETNYERPRFDDYAFGITQAAGGIAETGTIIFTDEQTSRRLGALTPWVHIAVLSRAKIHRTIVEAVATMGTDPNVIWATGPSKTADIEGILIEGVHGPGVQIALVV